MGAGVDVLGRCLCQLSEAACQLDQGHPASACFLEQVAQRERGTLVGFRGLELRFVVLDGYAGWHVSSPMLADRTLWSCRPADPSGRPSGQDSLVPASDIDVGEESTAGPAGAGSRLISSFSSLPGLK